MSNFSHRTVKELKVFIRKYNKHFRIMLSGKKKAELVKHINDGMGKSVTNELKKDYDMLVKISPKVKKEVVKKTEVKKGTHKMPDGSIMKNSNMPNKKKPVFTLAAPRPIGTVARPTKKSTTIRYKPKPKTPVKKPPTKAPAKPPAKSPAKAPTKAPAKAPAKSPAKKEDKVDIGQIATLQLNLLRNPRMNLLKNPLFKKMSDLTREAIIKDMKKNSKNSEKIEKQFQAFLKENKKNPVVKKENTKWTDRQEKQLQRLEKLNKGAIKVDFDILEDLRRLKAATKAPAKKEEPKQLNQLKGMIKTANQKTTKRNPKLYNEVIENIKLVLEDRNKLAKINELGDKGKSFKNIKTLKKWFDEKYENWKKFDKDLEKIMKDNKPFQMSLDQEGIYNRTLDFFENNRFNS